MNNLLEVCLIVLTLATSISVPAEFPVIALRNSFAGIWEQAEATAGGAQPMQKGVSVKLPVSSNAVLLPDADKEDSLILSVTDDGTVYFGVDPISPAVLAEKVKGDVSRRAEKKLYIKADARTPYANVIKVMRQFPGLLCKVC
jgi:biopolymer transport protein ExbD/TolR